jgi:hypothetical protein
MPFTKENGYTAYVSWLPHNETVGEGTQIHC